MTIAEIIKAVRWCIDEESNNTSEIADVIDEKDDAYMDNIIKAKINDALHWLVIIASSSTVLSDSKKIGETYTTLTMSDYNQDLSIGVVTLPEDKEIINVSRIRATDWQKAVIPAEDTEDEALMMFNETSMGTVDRPQAVIMREDPIRILLQPATGKATVSYIGLPKNVDTSDSSADVDVPDKLRSSFIYYIAYLLLSAYDDTKASQMYTIALQQLGAATSK